MNKRQRLIYARIFFSLLGLTAIGTQLLIHVKNGFSVINFFSYFTNLANIFSAFVLIISAIYLIRRQETTATDDIIRGTSTVSMAIVGIVFSILLRNEDLGSLLPWVNTVVHYIMPVFAVFDWVYQPAKTNFRVKHLLLLLIFPLIYLAYTMIRGSFVGWYPYPFLNPDKLDGYRIVTLYCLGILAAFILVSWLMIAFGNKFFKKELS